MSELNLFMVCFQVNKEAFSKLNEGLSFHRLKKDQLDEWIRLHGEDQYNDFIKDYYHLVYKDKERFFKRCIVVLKGNEIVGSCFAWKAYDEIETIHWFKVKKEYEGLGIGRALLTKVFEDIKEYPVYLHTHPTSFKAIKLYQDFGFSLINNILPGIRKNDYLESLPILKKEMPQNIFIQLQTTQAPEHFTQLLKHVTTNEF